MQIGFYLPVGVAAFVLYPNIRGRSSPHFEFCILNYSPCSFDASSSAELTPTSHVKSRQT